MLIRITLLLFVSLFLWIYGAKLHKSARVYYGQRRRARLRKQIRDLLNIESGYFSGQGIVAQLFVFPLVSYSFVILGRLDMEVWATVSSYILVTLFFLGFLVSEVE